MPTVYRVAITRVLYVYADTEKDALKIANTTADVRNRVEETSHVSVPTASDVRRDKWHGCCEPYNGPAGLDVETLVDAQKWRTGKAE